MRTDDARRVIISYSIKTTPFTVNLMVEGDKKPVNDDDDIQANMHTHTYKHTHAMIDHAPACVCVLEVNAEQTNRTNPPHPRARAHKWL